MVQNTATFTGGATARGGDAVTRGGAGGRAVQPAGPLAAHPRPRGTHYGVLRDQMCTTKLIA